MSAPFIVRSSERVDYKRCQKKWFWRWRMGLVPRGKSFGALELGTWIHAALAEWYSQPKRKAQQLPKILRVIATHHINQSRGKGANEESLTNAHKIWNLGAAMLTAYGDHYGTDDELKIIGAEIPLEFELGTRPDATPMLHKLKPDAVFHDSQGRLMLLETKTAATIRTEHLIIDDQARPYGAMAERALINAGVISKSERLYGIMYNFLRKGYPDQRATDSEGRSLNKNGTVSKKQPAPLFKRHIVRLGHKAKIVTLKRLYDEVVEITTMTALLRRKPELSERLGKTPHYSCPKTCGYFTMCTLEDEGADITEMQQGMFTRVNPYLYHEESADDPLSFEMS